MRRTLALLCVAQVATSSAAGDGPCWHSFEEGLRAAATSDLRVLVVASTRGCAWCKKLERDVLSRREVQDYVAARFVPARLDGADRRTSIEFGGRRFSPAELAAAYGVAGLPATLFLEATGQLISRLPGYHPADRYLEALRQVAEQPHGDRRHDAEERTTAALEPGGNTPHAAPKSPAGEPDAAAQESPH
jgi:thioredoxin-related protein